MWKAEVIVDVLLLLLALAVVRLPVRGLEVQGKELWAKASLPRSSNILQLRSIP